MGIIRIKENKSYIPLTIFLIVSAAIISGFIFLEKFFSLSHAFLLNLCAQYGVNVVFLTTFEMLFVGAVLLGYILVSTIFLVWLERKVAGHMQSRLGPMRTGGWHGWLQPLIDGFKLIFKEDIIPSGADKFVFMVAPFIVFVPSIMMLAVIPFSEKLVAVDLNMGLVYILGVSSIGVIGIVMAGWSSNNKYSLLGGLRSAAQMVSYEVPRAISILGVVMLAGSFSLVDIVNAQDGLWFVIPQFLGFMVYFIASLAEINRAPFDIPEAESELVSGFHTEYSGLRFSFFFISEYANMFIVSAIAALLFLGGWKPLFFSFISPVFWFILKTYFFAFVIIWIRWTLPRYRVDQLMDLCWKFLIPVSFVNLFLTAVVIMLRKA